MSFSNLFSHRDARTGFTLVELVLVISTTGVLAGVASVRFTGALQQSRVDSAARRIKADLTMARQHAFAGSSSVTVEFIPATDSYTIPELTDIDKKTGDYSVTLSESPFMTSLISASLGGDADVTFNRYGQPDSGGTITVQAGGYQKTVTIDADTGRATIP